MWNKWVIKNIDNFTKNNQEKSPQIIKEKFVNSIFQKYENEIRDETEQIWRATIENLRNNFYNYWNNKANELLDKSVEEIKEKLRTYNSKKQLEDDFENWGKLILNRIDNYASIIIPNFNEDKEEDLINDKESLFKIKTDFEKNFRITKDETFKDTFWEKFFKVIGESIIIVAKTGYIISGAWLGCAVYAGTAAIARAVAGTATGTETAATGTIAAGTETAATGTIAAGTAAATGTAAAVTAADGTIATGTAATVTAVVGIEEFAVVGAAAGVAEVAGTAAVKAVVAADITEATAIDAAGAIATSEIILITNNAAAGWTFLITIFAEAVTGLVQIIDGDDAKDGMKNDWSANMITLQIEEFLPENSFTEYKFIDNHEE